MALTLALLVAVALFIGSVLWTHFQLPIWAVFAFDAIGGAIILLLWLLTRGRTT